MATDSAHRHVSITRDGHGGYVAANDRGGQIGVGTGSDAEFSPAELLLVAIAACTGIDVDTVTSRRAEPESFEISADADKVRDEQGNHLTGIEVTFRVTFPAGEAGDAARAVLPDIVRQSHDRLCTVSRTIELGTQIATKISAQIE
jgi:uncharacterized OsmC-like protein